MRTIIFLATVLSMTVFANAATRYVNSTGSADFTTIQAAINAAASGDRILVADGLYTGTGNRDIDFDGKNILIASQNGPTNCIIDCNASATDRHRAFYFHSSETNGAVVKGFTVKRGFEENGGAFFCDNSSPVIANCLIVYNGASSCGAGIYCGNLARPKIINCTLSKNIAGSQGSAIYSDNQSKPAILNSILWENDPNEIQSSQIEISYSIISGGYPGLGNFDVPPGFVDYQNDDFHLQSEGWRWDRQSQIWV